MSEHDKRLGHGINEAGPKPSPAQYSVIPTRSTKLARRRSTTTAGSTTPPRTVLTTPADKLRDSMAMGLGGAWSALRELLCSERTTGRTKTT